MKKMYFKNSLTIDYIASSFTMAKYFLVYNKDKCYCTLWNISFTLININYNFAKLYINVLW